MPDTCLTAGSVWGGQVAQLSQFPNNAGYERQAHRTASTDASPEASAAASITLQSTGGSAAATQVELNVVLQATD